MGSSPSGSRNSFHVFSALIIHLFLGGSEVVEEGGAGRRWSIVERAFGALDCSVDGIVVSTGDGMGEDTRVDVPPTSREAIKDICAGRSS